MRRFNLVLATALLLGVSAEGAAGGTVLRSRVVPTAAPAAAAPAPQTIAGEPAAGTEWEIEKGSVKLREVSGGAFRLDVKLKGLIVPLLDEPFPVDPSAFPFPVSNPATCANFGFPAGVPCFGFSPVPFLLARLVCHDAAGEAEVVTTTAPAPLSAEGDGKLRAIIDVPEVCFAPVVLIGGVQPDGVTPGRWLATTGF